MYICENATLPPIDYKFEFSLSTATISVKNIHIVKIYRREKEKKFGKNKEFCFPSCRYHVITFLRVDKDFCPAVS